MVVSQAHTPLTIDVALSIGSPDVVTALVIVAVLALYWWCWRRSTLSLGRALLFTILGAGVWLASAVSFIGAYADVLFWVRALQFVLLLLVVPFGLALGMPLTALRDAVGERGRRRIDAALRSRFLRVLTSPPVTSAGVLALPWLIYFTGWYETILRNNVVDVATRLLMVAIGFGYFYTRLQLDPVPRRYPQALSLGITVIETIGDGILGIVIWQGPLIAAGYYASLGRHWGPDMRLDQTIGAGILWILGDVVGLPFLMALFARFRADERVREREEDARIEERHTTMTTTDTTSGAAGPTPAHQHQHQHDEPADTGLWWENDPGLRDRFRR